MAIQFLSGFDADGNSQVTGTFSVSSVANDNSTYGVINLEEHPYIAEQFENIVEHYKEKDKEEDIQNRKRILSKLK